MFSIIRGIVWEKNNTMKQIENIIFFKKHFNRTMESFILKSNKQLTSLIFISFLIEFKNN
jgi:hypothetical protein